MILIASATDRSWETSGSDMADIVHIDLCARDILTYFEMID